MSQLLFIQKQGSVIHKEGESLLVKFKGEAKGLYPLENVDAVIAMGRVEITNAFLRYALARNIKIIIADRTGVFKGKFYGLTGKNIVARLLQYKGFASEEKKKSIAVEIVRSKIRNTMKVLKDLKSPVYSELKDSYTNAMDSLNCAETIEQIRGIEGSFAAQYFRNFPGLLIHHFNFKKRIRRPPTDPVNAMLSLGYTVLFFLGVTVIESKGLEPYLGFLHDVRYSHPALVSDMIEPFRAMVTDAAIIELINHEIIKQEHFRKEDDKVLMTSEGLNLYYRQLQQLLQREYEAHDGQKYTIVQAMEKNVAIILQYLNGKKTKPGMLQFK
ncbi:MAG: CRISPR-associated endonuclease Cas1 [Calditrichia bacterium]